MREQTVAEYLDHLAAREPAPGGGAAAALAAAQGAALLAMVARYSDTAKYAEHADVIGAVLTEADALRERSLQLAADDAEAFSAVGAAYGLPKATDEDKAARSAAIATALVGAGAPPAAVVEVGARLVELAETLLPVGNRNVITDVAAAADAARAAVTTARVNVEINLGGIKDADAAARFRAAIAGVDDVAARARRGHLRGPRDDRADLMSAVLSGKELAASIRAGVTADAEALTARGVTPTLAIVTATDDGGSAWYVSSIVKAAAKVGIAATVVDLFATPERLTAELRRLAADPAVHGIILQTPLPGGASRDELAGAIPPAKDVDGASPESLGRLVAGLPAFAPATAAAVLALLDHHGVALEGRHAVVVGRSTVVGKPVAHLLLDRNATVTVCHSRTVDLPAVAATGDVLVAAVGRPKLVTADYVKSGAVVVDVGTNDTADGLVGDVDADSVGPRAAGLTPVPGGVGPVTTALLLRHTVEAAAAAAAG